jgi:hypothetical protein
MNVKKGIPVTIASITEEKRTLGQGVLSLVRKIYLRGQGKFRQSEAVSVGTQQSDQRHGEIRAVRNKQPGEEFKPGR